ncbi:MAG: thioesterase family protein, partial [Pseudomonadota bacterium]
HIRHLDEVKALEPIYAETQMLEGAGKKLHLFHWLRHAEGRLLATGEHMLLHVSLETRATCAPTDAVEANLAAAMALQGVLPTPEGAGQAIGKR